MRQSRSPFDKNAPLKIPVIPAMRPCISIRRTEASPIRLPPRMAAVGVNIVVIYAITCSHGDDEPLVNLKNIQICEYSNMINSEILELDKKVDEASELLSVMAHPKRLLIMCHLLTEELSVTALADRAGMPQPTLSQHLSKLRDLDLVLTRRSGNVIFYRLASSEVEQILKVLHSVYCA